MHVAISLGNADVNPVPGGTPEDIERIHFDLIRRLFEAGHVLVYGGDLKPTGLSEKLLELGRKHAVEADGTPADPTTRLRNAVAWPIHLNYSAEELAAAGLTGVFENYDPPADVELTEEQKTTFAKPDTPEHRVWWSRSFSSMREQLNRTLDARVIVCGRGIGSSGAIPGIFEEALCALRAGTPLFIVGGFGGVAVPILEALSTGTTSVFTREAQHAHPPMAEFYAYLDSIGRGDLADFESMVGEMHKAGIAGLNNGMSAAENEILFSSTDWSVVADLLIEGLGRLQD